MMLRFVAWPAVLVASLYSVCLRAQEMDPAVRTPVNTSIGLVYGGRNITVRGTPYFYYTGIPYATAKRFQDPEVFPRRDFPTVALAMPPQCPQWDETRGRVRGREENCLHLSVYTRRVSGITSDPAARPYPVLFIVSSNKFTSIPSSSPDFFVDNDIVVVTVSYRVGAFGFLSTMDENAKGNYGLLDLEIALMWVKNNIDIFGGDPRQVTLMGQGAGASLVSSLLLNPRIQALKMLSGAITMSGSPLCLLEQPLKDPKEQAKRLAEALDCDTSDTDSIVNCLKSESLERIVMKQTELENQTLEFLPPIVGPVIDVGLREFPAISEMPLTTLQRGNLSSIPLISGVVSDEGALLFTEMFSHRLQQAQDPHASAKVVQQILPDIVKHMTKYSNRIDEILALMKYHYFRDINVDDAEMVTKATVQVITDLLYNECQERWANLYRQASNSEVFSYVFDYRGRLSTLEPLISNLDNRSQPVVAGLRRAVSHGDDLLYLTNNKLVPVEDSAMQEEMTRLWSSFIKNHQSISAEWNSKQRYADYTNYLLIDRPSREQRKYRSDSMSFLHYVNVLAESQGDQSTEHTVERAEEGTDYELIMWIMVGVAAFLLVACVVATLLFVRQKKKTTFVTR